MGQGFTVYVYLTLDFMASMLVRSPDATLFSLSVAFVALARLACLSLKAGGAVELTTFPLVSVAVV